MSSKRHTISVSDFLTHHKPEELASDGNKKLIVILDVLTGIVLFRVERKDGIHEGFDNLASAIERYNEL